MTGRCNTDFFFPTILWLFFLARGVSDWSKHLMRDISPPWHHLILLSRSHVSLKWKTCYIPNRPGQLVIVAAPSWIFCQILRCFPLHCYIVVVKWSLWFPKYISRACMNILRFFPLEIYIFSEHVPFYVIWLLIFVNNGEKGSKSVPTKVVLFLYNGISMCL